MGVRTFMATDNDKGVTREDIMRLGQTNPIVHACLDSHKNGSSSFEKAMMIAVKILVAQNDDLMNKYMKSMLNSKTKSYIPGNVATM